MTIGLEEETEKAYSTIFYYDPTLRWAHLQKFYRPGLTVPVLFSLYR